MKVFFDVVNFFKFFINIILAISGLIFSIILGVSLFYNGEVNSSLIYKGLISQEIGDVLSIPGYIPEKHYQSDWVGEKIVFNYSPSNEKLFSEKELREHIKKKNWHFVTDHFDELVSRYTYKNSKHERDEMIASFYRDDSSVSLIYYDN